MKRPQTSNADDWLLFLQENDASKEYAAVQIAEAIEYRDNILRKMAAHICSFTCPNVWPSDETQPHSDLCKAITATVGNDNRRHHSQTTQTQ